ncbi:hypothetical protein AVEN_219504-1 [Araneus ventricosus]|uniref:Uncharacterized protein n=1 Tax=Araneus ventricosus TaxID=182803 RepID=A0A4Y2BP55_ARAVE|nr:hypothetical protein AVEN_219504-1 [Araneus ventricosus]
MIQLAQGRVRGGPLVELGFEVANLRVQSRDSKARHIHGLSAPREFGCSTSKPVVSAKNRRVGVGLLKIWKSNFSWNAFRLPGHKG